MAAAEPCFADITDNGEYEFKTNYLGKPVVVQYEFYDNDTSGSPLYLGRLRREILKNGKIVKLEEYSSEVKMVTVITEDSKQVVSGSVNYYKLGGAKSGLEVTSDTNEELDALDGRGVIYQSEKYNVSLYTDGKLKYAKIPQLNYFDGKFMVVDFTCKFESGKIIQITSFEKAKSMDSRMVVFELDGLGRLVRRVSFSGDSRKALTEEVYSYSLDGNQIESNPSDSFLGKSIINIKRNSSGRIDSVVTKYTDDLIETAYNYDSNGNWIDKVVKRNGEVIQKTVRKFTY